MSTLTSFVEDLYASLKLTHPGVNFVDTSKDVGYLSHLLGAKPNASDNDSLGANAPRSHDIPPSVSRTRPLRVASVRTTPPWFTTRSGGRQTRARFAA